MVPSAVSSLLSAAPAVAFSGSRSVVPGAAASVVPFVSGRVLVGCARGVDAAFRGFFPSASVFSASSFGSGRGSFAARSVAVVRSVFAAGGVFVSFPSGVCPSSLSPSPVSSRAFSGSGSGSWASLAFAVGLGVPCVLFSPASACFPCFLLSWGFVPAGGGWFVSSPRAVQLSLF